MSTFDWGRPLRQKNGRAARELETVDASGRRLVAIKCANERHWQITTATAGGLLEGAGNGCDLENYDPEPSPPPAIPDWEQYKEYGGLMTREDERPVRYWGRLERADPSTPLVFVVKDRDGERATHRHLDGRVLSDRKTHMDIVLIPPPEPVKHEVELFLVRHRDAKFHLYESDEYLDPASTVVARKTVTFTAGEGL